METAIKVKFAMLLEHNQRPGEYGYNQTATHFFETEGEFFESWGENLPDGVPHPASDDASYTIHKRFGTLYVDDSGVPVACVSIEECPPEEAMKQRRPGRG